MGDFNKAYNYVIKQYEKGYVNDKDDAGGETWDGLARNYNKEWKGWPIIDSMKKHPEFPFVLYKDAQLQQLKKEHYKKKYWDIFDGDNLPNQVATELFDNTVHSGSNDAILFLQQSLNILNKNQALYDDIVEDGIYGKQTFNALLANQAYYQISFLVNVINIAQGAHYFNKMKVSHFKEKYIGWFKRVVVKWNS